MRGRPRLGVAQVGGGRARRIVREEKVRKKDKGMSSGVWGPTTGAGEA
jgi:hypothetical protein